MKSKTTLFLFGIGGLAALALAISCATVDRVMMAPPLIPGAKYVGMDTCGTCHEKEVKNFKLTQHARIQIPGDEKRVPGQGCESCHGPGSLHVDAGGGRGKFIINPGKDPEACFQCHIDKKAQFNLPYHHPLKEGRMSCMSCHNPHGEDIHNPNGMNVARVNDVCAQCHREQTRPHVFDHQAVREGCTNCHNVHGSINPKMLTERDQNLCLKCHAQIGSSANVFVGNLDNHKNFVTRGTCFSAGCHEAIHGSNFNHHLRY
jgi:predicted CXXCH cytochrome family protein